MFNLPGFTMVDRYIMRQVALSFVIVLGVLTSIVWLTSSLRQLDLVVSQGQTLLLFMKVTLLALPLLISLIAPFCLFIAALFILNKLNTDSELIVMSAAGLSQPKLARPLIFVAAFVTLIGYALSLALTPASLKIVRENVIAARADFITQAIKPGLFTSIDQNLTIHVRERGANGLLQGVFVNDERDPEAGITYLSQKGFVTRTAAGSFLVLQNGEVVRRPKKGNGTGSVISFESYAFSLTSFANGPLNLTFPAQERSTIELFELLGENLEDQRFAGRVRSEINDRFAVPLYSFAFTLIAFAAMGRAKTTRQNRGESIIMAVIAVAVLRILGFIASGLVARSPLAIALIYVVPIGGILLAARFGLAARPPDLGLWRKLAPKVSLSPLFRVKP